MICVLLYNVLFYIILNPMHHDPVDIVKFFTNKIGRYNTRLIKSHRDSKSREFLQVINHTAFLPDDIGFSARLDAINRGWNELPKCYCGDKVVYKGEWRKTCSNRCAYNDPRKIKSMLDARDQAATNRNRKASLIQKYGYSTNSQRPEIKAKRKGQIYDYKFLTALKEKVGNLSDDEIRQYLESNDIAALSKEFGCSYPHALSLLSRFGLYVAKPSKSQPHRIIESFLSSVGVEFRSNDRTLIRPKEVDIFVPLHNLAIEINGAHWHSEHMGKDSSYHLKKTESCLAKNVRLLHFWDFEILNTPDLVFGIILDKLKPNRDIDIRHTSILEIDRRWEDSKDYVSLGYILERNTPPRYWFLKGGKLSLDESEKSIKLWDCGTQILRHDLTLM